MKTKKALALVLVLVTVCTLLAACGAKKGDSLAGDWASEDFDGKFIYTFKEDGTGNYDAYGTDMPFTYKVDGDKLSIQYEDVDVPWETTFKIEGDTLTVKDDTGNDVIYHKK